MKAGDEIERKHRREQALARIRMFRKKLPPDWKFDREEANSRQGRRRRAMESNDAHIPEMVHRAEVSMTAG